MKKIAFLALTLLLIIITIFSFYLYRISKPVVNNISQDLALQEHILNNSYWLYLKPEDFYGYLNGTYTEPVQTIISSLEEAIPVIFQTSNTKFGNFEKGTFIVASAFDGKNKVYIYNYNEETKKYSKSLISLETLLENATAALIYNETEGL